MTNKNERVESRVCVIGYYGHANLGDQSYIESFKRFFEGIFERNSIEFIDCDQIHNVQFSESDLIVVGGGDVLNEYFIDKIIAVFNGKRNKIIAVSVGLPYKSILTNSNKLSIIDYVFVRTKVDLELFKTYFHPHKVHYLPDISQLLLQQSEKVSLGELGARLQGYNRIKRKTVGIMLSRHIYHERHEREYQNFLRGMCKVIRMLLDMEMHVVLIPFNTNEKSMTENDEIINNDILHEMRRNGTSLQNLTVVGRLDVEQMLRIYDYLDYTIPMRFHACLFSLYKKVPFLPVFTTRKIKNFLVDIDWNWGYELDTNEIDIPVGIREDILFRRFTGLCQSNAEKLQLKMTSINIQWGKAIVEAKNVLRDTLSNNIEKGTGTKSPIDKQIEEIHESINAFAKSNGYNSFEEVKEEHVQDIIVSIVSFKLTGGRIVSDYTWGLKNKMFKRGYKYSEEWKWILNDIKEGGQEIQGKLPNNTYGIFNLGFVDQEDYSGVHRSGWQYVYEKIRYLHNENAEILLDLYVDRTFHWNRIINKSVGLIPYKKAWMGFIHHTFETTFSDYNCTTLLRNTEFRESLETCRGIFVLSRYLKKRWEHELEKISVKVPVYALTHPTETDVQQFSLSKFMENNDKKIIHVGGWLRNAYSFYNLEIPKSIKFSYGFLVGDKTTNPIVNYNGAIRKVVLKGRGMDNYFPKRDFLLKLHDVLTEDNSYQGENAGNVSCEGVTPNCCTVGPSPSPNASTSPNCCNGVSIGNMNDNRIRNNWYKEFYSDVSEKVKSVDFIHYLENDQYDKLLTQNIVFINLVDASAVNTVLECVVRNTPIIVNKHPAVVEILGDEYPLYLKTDVNNYNKINNDFSGMLRDATRIKRAHMHLKKLDKTTLSVEYFTGELIRIVTGGGYPSA